MARRRKDRTGERVEVLFKLGLFGVALLALAAGGVNGFAHAFTAILTNILFVAITVAGLTLVFFLTRRIIRKRRAPNTSVERLETSSLPALPAKEAPGSPAANPVPRWTEARIRTALEEIDWYQFEKFCATLLEADGFSVERKGGAQPDGGVDLIVEKNGARALIQCKHWKTWGVKENVVRELLGSMTHFNVSQGAIYTLKGWTEPAARFARQHAITLVNGDELAASAQHLMKSDQLEIVLNRRNRRCPKCESTMVWREGDFTPFWGCSRYPRCRGRLAER